MYIYASVYTYTHIFSENAYVYVCIYTSTCILDTSGQGRAPDVGSRGHAFQGKRWRTSLGPPLSPGFKATFRPYDRSKGSAHTRRCKCVRAYTYIEKETINNYMYVCHMYVYIHIHMCEYTHMYTRTHIQTCMYTQMLFEVLSNLYIHAHTVPHPCQPWANMMKRPPKSEEARGVGSDVHTLMRVRMGVF